MRQQRESEANEAGAGPAGEGGAAGKSPLTGRIQRKAADTAGGASPAAGATEGGAASAGPVDDPYGMHLAGGARGGGKGGGSVTVLPSGGRAGQVGAAVASDPSAELSEDDIRLTLEGVVPIWSDYVEEDTAIQFDFEVGASGRVLRVETPRCIPENNLVRDRLRELFKLLVFPPPKQKGAGKSESAHASIDVSIRRKRG